MKKKLIIGLLASLIAGSPANADVMEIYENILENPSQEQAARDTYSNEFICVNGTCEQVNLKPMRWNVEQHRVIKLKFSPWFDDAVIQNVTNQLHQVTLGQVTFIPIKADINGIGNPADGEILIKDVPPPTDFLGIVQRIVIFYTNTPTEWLINKGIATIRNDLTGSRLIQVILHELGHIFGLDHSQGSSHFTKDGSEWFEDRDKTLRPVMYPVVTTNPAGVFTYEDIHFLRETFSIDTGCNANVEGYALFNGEPMTGIILNFRNKVNRSESITVPIDNIRAGDGFFSLTVPEGSYTVRFDPVRINTNGAGSTIGAYDRDVSNFSEPRFFHRNRGNELSKRNRGKRSTVNLVAGENRVLLIGDK